MNSWGGPLVKVGGGLALVVLVGLGATYAKPISSNGVVTAAKNAPAAAAIAASPAEVAAPSGQRPVVRLVSNAKPVPEFSVKTFDGKVITPAALKGKVAIVNFWATWCGPCRAEIPAFIAMQEKYGDRLVILGLSEDETGVEGVKQFVAANHMSYPVGMASEKLDNAFGGTRGIPSLPSTYVIDPNGRIVQRHVGLIDTRMYELEVRALLGLQVDATVEHFDDDGSVSPENTAEAKSIPGIDLAAMTPSQKKAALEKLNTDLCTCGCKSTVARCRIDDPTCETSLPLAKKIVADIIRTVK